MVRKIHLILLSLFVAVGVMAQAPSGYYDAAKGKSGASLKTALFLIIADHTVRSYDNLWTDFESTDVRADGKIWDMYSNTTNYTPGGPAQGKNYKGEGDSYNREHSFPKSWFNDAKPMYTDLFHLYPTDGYVNNRRSNYPFGETNGETYKSDNGFSKLGACTVPGYSGTVFEPNDEYKGDFARTYFYMATAYESQIASWSSPMLSGNKYTAYAPWALQMLLRWAKEDPVSQKEIDRNNAVYGIQHNRNPFIDFPGLEQYVWGSQTSTAFDPDNYENTGGGTEPEPPVTEVAAPTFTPAQGTVERGTEVTISTETEGAYIYYRIDEGEWNCLYPPVKLTINASCQVEAYALLGNKRSDVVKATYALPSQGVDGKQTYLLVEKESELQSGSYVLVVCPNKNVAMSVAGSNIYTAVDVTIDDPAQLTTETGTASLPVALQLGGAPDAWTLYDTTAQLFLALTSSDNKLHTLAAADSDNARWRISIGSNGVATISPLAYDSRSLQYNASSPRFACYTSKQQSVSLYQYTLPTAIWQAVQGMQSTTGISVYDVQGHKVATLRQSADLQRALPAGIYVIGGRKVLVR